MSALEVTTDDLQATMLELGRRARAAAATTS